MFISRIILFLCFLLFYCLSIFSMDRPGNANNLSGDISFLQNLSSTVKNLFNRLVELVPTSGQTGTNEEPDKSQEPANQLPPSGSLLDQILSKSGQLKPVIKDQLEKLIKSSIEDIDKKISQDSDFEFLKPIDSAQERELQSISSQRLNKLNEEIKEQTSIENFNAIKDGIFLKFKDIKDLIKDIDHQIEELKHSFDTDPLKKEQFINNLNEILNKYNKILDEQVIEEVNFDTSDLKTKLTRMVSDINYINELLKNNDIKSIKLSLKSLEVAQSNIIYILDYIRGLLLNGTTRESIKNILSGKKNALLFRRNQNLKSLSIVSPISIFTDNLDKIYTSIVNTYDNINIHELNQKYWLNAFNRIIRDYIASPYNQKDEYFYILLLGNVINNIDNKQSYQAQIESIKSIRDNYLKTFEKWIYLYRTNRYIKETDAWLAKYKELNVIHPATPSIKAQLNSALLKAEKSFAQETATQKHILKFIEDIYHNFISAINKDTTLSKDLKVIWLDSLKQEYKKITEQDYKIKDRNNHFNTIVLNRDLTDIFKKVIGEIKEEPGEEESDDSEWED